MPEVVGKRAFGAAILTHAVLLGALVLSPHPDRAPGARAAAPQETVTIEVAEEQAEIAAPDRVAEVAEREERGHDSAGPPATLASGASASRDVPAARERDARPPPDPGAVSLVMPASTPALLDSKVL